MAGTGWQSLSAGQPARAGDVNKDLAWLEQDIVPQKGGNTTDGAYDLGTTTARWAHLHADGINVDASGSSGLIVDGSTGIVTIRGGLSTTSASLDVGGDLAMMIPRITTAQKTALTAANGMMVYDTNLNQFQFRQNGAWVQMGAYFQTSRTSFALDAINGTETALSVSGPGRLIGLIMDGGGGATSTAIFELGVYVDGVAIVSYSTPTHPLGAAQFPARAALTADGDWIRQGTSSALDAGHYVGWGFEQSLTVYVDANTILPTTAYIAYEN